MSQKSKQYVRRSEVVEVMQIPIGPDGVDEIIEFLGEDFVGVAEPDEYGNRRYFVWNEESEIAVGEAKNYLIKTHGADGVRVIGHGFFDSRYYDAASIIEGNDHDEVFIDRETLRELIAIKETQIVELSATVENLISSIFNLVDSPSVQSRSNANPVVTNEVTITKAPTGLMSNQMSPKPYQKGCGGNCMCKRTENR